MKDFKEQTRATVKLAFPIIITQMGQMLLGIVDIFMVGKLGPEAIGSVAVGTALFTCVNMFGFGLITSLDYFISKSRGENNPEAVRLWRINGVYFAILMSIPLQGLLLFLSANLWLFGVPPDTAARTHEFLNWYAWSLMPTMVFLSCRIYLQTIGQAKFVTKITILANILNLFFNWLFISGHWGLPALGTRGSALSTDIVRYGMTFILLHQTFKGEQKIFEPINFSYIKNLMRLGFPAALQGTFEVAIFSLSTAFASQLDPLSLAAHSIVLNIASFTFMVPLGISLAAAIRVGFFYGQKDGEASRSAGNNALILGAGFMAFAGVIMFIFGNPMIGVFTADPKVIEIAKRIIIWAAIFQVADGVQVVSTGILRGLGNTKASAIANLLSYWAIALPVSWYLCFKTSLGIVGLWMGLAVGLILVASVLLVIWRRLSGLLKPRVLA